MFPFKKLFANCKKCSCFNFCSGVSKKCTQVLKTVHVFKFCSGVSKNVPSFKKCSSIQNLFSNLKNVRVLGDFTKMFPFPKIVCIFRIVEFLQILCSISKSVRCFIQPSCFFFSKIGFLKNVRTSKFVWNFSKLFSILKYVLKKQKMFVLYKIVHASKFVQDFSKLFFVSKFVLKVQKMFVLQKIIRASKFVLKIQKSFMLHKNVHKLQKCLISEKCLGNSNFSVFIKFVHMFKKCSCFQICLQIQKIVHMFIFFTNSKNCFLFPKFDHIFQKICEQ